MDIFAVFLIVLSVGISSVAFIHIAKSIPPAIIPDTIVITDAIVDILLNISIRYTVQPNSLILVLIITIMI